MPEYAHPSVLVDTQWLANHLSNPNLRIIELDPSPHPCKNAHIPGAVFWDLFTDLLLPNGNINFDAIAFEKLMARSGITNDTTVIAYGSYLTTGAWIFWLLKVFGHENVRVLNGGYQKWKSEGRPLANELSTFPTTDYHAKTPDPSLRVLYPEVYASIGRSDRILLDVRTLQEYSGEWFFDQPPKAGERTGHIPGAVHLEHTLTFNEDGTFKSFNELKNLYTSKGVTAEKEVFPYCTIGGRSGYVWFVLKYLLGYPNVRNYDGSWNEWSRLADV
ncbi:sulfurtransferase [Nostoc sp. FACHB-152]|uniref:sulfurtransferase n=1 Tax=unclassified Nostoc TaxID=2593658 RepID=UPI0016843564|nr:MULTISPECIES: sulfurtransferase [unclassified Nostoc]MBD2446492.1 sulfurtransferase [Nostoc sp. FACHB-152]MBD2468711.1 sulfurtransferase [Nostoc sp. FACHB-145]